MMPPCEEDEKVQDMTYVLKTCRKQNATGQQKSTAAVLFTCSGAPATDCEEKSIYILSLKPYSQDISIYQNNGEKNILLFLEKKKKEE